MSIFKRRKKPTANEAASPAESDYDPTGRDYSHIDSVEKAAAAIASGELTQIMLFPEAFGGQPIAVNMVPVPHGIDQAKEMIDGTVLRFAQDGLIDKFTATPEYEGACSVPKRIVIKCTNSDPQKTGSFNPTIEIW